MSKILESNNYDNFELCTFNRDLRKIVRLKKTMGKHGWIDAYPCHVIQNGSGKFKIKAGHHRFEVAKQLGIPIKFVVCNDTATIHELEQSTTPWSVEDYLLSYCKTNKPDYQRVLNFHMETGMSISATINMFRGKIAAGGGGEAEDFKDGLFKIKVPNQSREIYDYLMLCKSLGIECYKSHHFVNAISRIMFIKEIDFNVMKKKTKQYKMLFEKKLNLDQFLDMLEDIYNRQAQKKVPLKFLAYQIAKDRQQEARLKNLKQNKK